MVFFIADQWYIVHYTLQAMIPEAKDKSTQSSIDSFLSKKGEMKG